MLALEAFSKFQRSFAILSDKEKKTDSPPPLLKSTVAVLLTFMSCIRQFLLPQTAQTSEFCEHVDSKQVNCVKYSSTSRESTSTW